MAVMAQLLNVVVVFIASFATLAASDRGTFNPYCEPFPNQRVVLVTVSSQFIHFFKNWLHHAKPFLTSTEMVVAVPEDDETMPLLEQMAETSEVNFTVHGSAVYGKKSTVRKTSMLQTRDNFGSNVYGHVVTKRPERLLPYLKMNCTVLYIDIDSAWASDPFVEIGAAGPHDIYITDDTLGNRGVEKWYACTCFLYMQPVQPIVRLLEMWARGLSGQWRNQPLFNELMKDDYEHDKSIDFAFLPFEKFPPGGVAHRYEDASIYHANYVKGNEKKVKFLQEHNKWSM